MSETILILVMALLVWAAVTDIKDRKIANWIPISIFGLFLVFITLEYFLGLDPVLVPVFPSFMTGLLTFLVFAGFFYFGFVGGGDVKLISAVAFWAGPKGIVPFIVIMAITGGLLAFFFMIKNLWGPDLATKKTKSIEGEPNSGNKKQVKKAKNKNKSGNIPYGIAISVGGLFAVNQILTNLIT